MPMTLYSLCGVDAARPVLFCGLPPRRGRLGIRKHHREDQAVPRVQAHALTADGPVALPVRCQRLSDPGAAADAICAAQHRQEQEPQDGSSDPHVTHKDDHRAGRLAHGRTQGAILGVRG